LLGIYVDLFPLCHKSSAIITPIITPTINPASGAFSATPIKRPKTPRTMLKIVPKYPSI